QVQGDIAGQVAEALNLALGAPEREKLEARPTASLEAYDAFLKGEAAAGHNPTLGPLNLQRAIDYYERAVALDSSFADAWAQLARAQAVYHETVTPTPAGATTARQA